MSIGLSVFGFIANEYKQIANQSLSAIPNTWSNIRWTIPKVKKQLFALTYWVITNTGFLYICAINSVKSFIVQAGEQKE
jgi:hypothetical protein